MLQNQWPATIDEGVGVVIATLSDEERASIADLAQAQLIGLHFGLGMWIRKHLGLWRGNDGLMQAIREHDQTIHPDPSIRTSMTSTLACPSGVTDTRRWATAGASTPAMRMAVASMRSMSIRWKAFGHCCAPGYVSDGWCFVRLVLLIVASILSRGPFHRAGFSPVR